MAAAVTAHAPSSGLAAASGLPSSFLSHHSHPQHPQHPQQPQQPHNPRMSSTTSPVTSLANSPSVSSASFSSVATPNTAPPSVAASASALSLQALVGCTYSSSSAAAAAFSSSCAPPGRHGVSCDACLFRKSRCAMNELVNKCYSCDFHRQDCTFTLANTLLSDVCSSQTRKRKLEDLVDAEPAKRCPSAGRLKK